MRVETIVSVTEPDEPSETIFPLSDADGLVGEDGFIDEFRLMLPANPLRLARLMAEDPPEPSTTMIEVVLTDIEKSGGGSLTWTMRSVACEVLPLTPSIVTV